MIAFFKIFLRTKLFNAFLNYLLPKMAYVGVERIPYKSLIFKYMMTGTYLAWLHGQNGKNRIICIYVATPKEPS